MIHTLKYPILSWPNMITCCQETQAVPRQQKVKKILLINVNIKWIGNLQVFDTKMAGFDFRKTQTDPASARSSNYASTLLTHPKN